MISHDELLSRLDYDKESGIFTWKLSTARRRSGEEAGGIFTCKKGKQYVVIGIKNKIYYAHRLAFLWVNGEFPPSHVDHIDSNGLNNRWNNLRLASRAENSKNVKIKKNNTSGVCGVYFNKQIKKWIAQIGIEGKVRSLGSFVNKEDAITVRQEEQKRLGFHINHGTKR